MTHHGWKYSLPDHLVDYYTSKQREPQTIPDPTSDLLQALDIATVNMLNNGGSQDAVKLARQAVLDHPESRWTPETLDYRTRQLYYK